jgi:carboxyl-terminal processing protease
MNNGWRVLLSVLLIVLTATAVFVGGFVVGHYASLPAALALPDLPGISRGPNPQDGGSAGAGAPDSLRRTFAPFWEAWDLVHEEYVDQPVDDVVLMQGAIRGMLDALGDEHSSYMSPSEYEIMSSSQSGELQGIGAYVEKAEEGGLRIVSPFPSSPAESAGLLPGDLIIQVDGEDITDTDLAESEMVARVRGEPGTSVHLTVLREGVEGALEFDVTRARIVIPSVESRMLPGQIGYVKINDFGDRTTQELTDSLESLLDQDARGLVVDLRNNPGGYLHTSIEVASQFLPAGTPVMVEQFGDGREVTYEAHRGGLATRLPLVVLINAGSASASEIVAGAIQDNGRGQVVGETSYGKGSVQNWHQLSGDNGAVRVTIARWNTPDGSSIHELGITPDVVVELSEDDHAAGRDPQLDRAVELLGGPAGASSQP